MDGNRLARMIFRRWLRKGANIGVEKVLKATGGETGTERQRRQQAQKSMRRVNQAMRMIRMISRMR